MHVMNSQQQVISDVCANSVRLKYFVKFFRTGDPLKNHNTTFAYSLGMDMDNILTVKNILVP